FEVPVRGADTGVDDVRGDGARRGGVAVLVVQRQVTLVDAIQTPRRRVQLVRRDRHALVLLDVRNRRIGGEAPRRRLAHLGRVPAQGVFERAGDLGAVLIGMLGRLRGGRDTVL